MKKLANEKIEYYQGHIYEGFLTGIGAYAPINVKCKIFVGSTSVNLHGDLADISSVLNSRNINIDRVCRSWKMCPKGDWTIEVSSPDIYKAFSEKEIVSWFTIVD